MTEFISIIVNGFHRTISALDLTYADLVGLINPNGVADGIVYTITYSKGPDSNREGSIISGGQVSVKDGMIFNVVVTNNA